MSDKVFRQGWNDPDHYIDRLQKGRGPYHNPVINVLLLIGFTLLLFFGLWLSLDGNPNGSTDGRYHTCGYVTADGVTNHLSEYSERCGK